MLSTTGPLSPVFGKYCGRSHQLTKTQQCFPFADNVHKTHEIGSQRVTQYSAKSTFICDQKWLLRHTTPLDIIIVIMLSTTVTEASQLQISIIRGTARRRVRRYPNVTKISATKIINTDPKYGSSHGYCKGGWCAGSEEDSDEYRGGVSGHLGGSNVYTRLTTL